MWSERLNLALRGLEGLTGIFFDLRETKLASTLVGKTLDVDDGFLKKIRVAEFKPGQTRIVLEVDDLSAYDAFLLPDPYRLIIDIHGKKSRTGTAANTQRKTVSGSWGDEVAGALANGASSGGVSSGGREDADDIAVDAAIEQKGGQKKSEKEHAIVAKVDKGDANAGNDDEEGDSKEETPAIVTKAEQDLAAADGKTPAAKKRSGSGGVVKTTVAVKGSSARIPKTIVDADEEDSTTVASAGTGRTTGKKGRGAPAREATSSAGDGTSDVSDSSGLVEKDLQPATTVATASPSTRTSIPASVPSSTSSTARTGSRGKSSRKLSATETADLETREARPTAAGDRSLTRALGLKIGKIVIDAGHGGHDTGTIGPNGLLEKDLVLDVARRLGRLLQARLGAEVIYTRRDDTFIPLETRTAIANREQADLFISIHATRVAIRMRGGWNLLPEFHFVSGGVGGGGARERGVGKIGSRAAGSGEEDRAQGKD